MSKKPMKAKHARAAVFVDQDFRTILAMQTRENEYLAIAKNYSTEELNQLAKAMGLLINEMEEKPFEDVIGRYYTDNIASADQSARGEFFTPRDISVLMARLSVDREQIIADNRIITAMDPCCGSGAMMLAFAEAMAPRLDLLRVTLQDINPTACHMAYINMTLWGIPAEIILGNTLKAQCLQRWTNVHWHRVGEEERRRALKMLNLMRQMSESSEPKPPALPPKTLPNTTGRDIQLELF